MFNLIRNRNYHHHHYIHYHHYNLTHHHHQPKRCTMLIFNVLIFITISTTMASIISSSASTSSLIQGSTNSYSSTFNNTSFATSSMPSLHHPLLSSNSSSSSFSATTRTLFNHTNQHLINSPAHQFFQQQQLLSPSPSNFTTSAQSSPFATPYDAVQWSSRQAVASGPVFIGDSVVIHSNSAIGNFSGGNLTLPHWYNITFLLNISRDVPEDLGVVLFGYVLPFLLVATLITNLLIVIVLSQSHMRTPTNLVLLAMAIADLLTLLSPAPWYFYLYTLGNHQSANSLYPPRTCYLFHVMYEVLPALFHTYSIWLTLLLAGQRYVYVCHLNIARTWCTVPRVVKAMVAIFLVAALHQSTRFIDRDFLTVRFIWNEKVIEGCEYLTASWVDYYIGEDVYYLYYYIFRIIFVHICPCSALVLLNVLLFRALSRTAATRERLFAGTLAAATATSTHDGNPTSFYSQFGNSNSKASLPYNNCLTPMRTVTTTSVITANGQSKNAGMMMTMMSSTGVPGTTTMTAQSSLDSPPTAMASGFSSRKVSLEIGNNHGGANNRGSPTVELDNSTEMTAVVLNNNNNFISSSARPSIVQATTGFSGTASSPIQNLPPTSTMIPSLTAAAVSISASKRDANSTTIMLIVIVSMFLLLEIPLTITTILHVVQNVTSVNLVDYNTLNTIILITNFFIILSYPINFAIYCGMSRKFRTTFSELFLDGRTGICRWCWWRKWSGRGEGNGFSGNGRGIGGAGSGGNGVFAAPASERVTTAFITGASSSTFGVTSKSLTSCVTGPGGVDGVGGTGSRKPSSEIEAGVHVVVGVMSNGGKADNSSLESISANSNSPQNLAQYQNHAPYQLSPLPPIKSLQIGATEVIDYEPEEEPGVLETSL